jgi:sec-independent protein translocase protein TatB
MFDITSSKLLLLGIVALIVIGPKDLPVLLRTIGKYVGIIKRQAAEFRVQFDEAMRESELEQLKKDVESMGAEAESAMRDAERSATTQLDTVKADIEKSTADALADKPLDPASHDADGLPVTGDGDARLVLNGAEGPTEAASGEPAEAEPARVEHKSGA